MAEHLNQEGGKETEMKSVLVIDTPKTCEDCPCMNWAAYEDEILCGVLGEELFVDSSEEVIKSKRCPLKPMPGRIVYKVPETIEDYKVGKQLEMAYGDGWNACIEELEK